MAAHPHKQEKQRSAPTAALQHQVRMDGLIERACYRVLTASASYQMQERSRVKTNSLSSTLSLKRRHIWTLRVVTLTLKLVDRPSCPP